MLAAQLQRFIPFSGLDEQDLARIAATARTLKLPAGRWLIRPGRTLQGSYYLLRGRVRTHRPDAEIGGDDARARRPIVPGALAVKTLAPTSLLVVKPVADDPLPGVADAASELSVLLPRRVQPGWEHRFLQQRVVRHLGPRQWQRIFRGMRPHVYLAGEKVVVQGQAGVDFYVLCSGLARVCRNGRELARLAIGDFFGEDALVLGAPRNATVTMIREGRVMAVSRELFLAELLAKALPGVCRVDADVGLRVGLDPFLRPGYVPLLELRDHAVGLDRKRRYSVRGDTPAETALGTFLLLQAGLDAAPGGDAGLANFT